MYFVDCFGVCVLSNLAYTTVCFGIGSVEGIKRNELLH